MHSILLSYSSLDVLKLHYAVFLSDPIQSIGPTKDSICSLFVCGSSVLGNFKSSDWSNTKNAVL